MDKCKQNIFASDSAVIGFQVIVNYLVLILFLFLYGPVMARFSIRNEIDITVDDVVQGMTKEEVTDLLGGKSKDSALQRITANLDKFKKSSQEKYKAKEDAMKANNRKLWGTAFKEYAIISAVVVAVMVTIRLFGFCLNIKNALMMAVLTTFFVFLTELVVINLTKLFMPVGTDEIKGAVGGAMIKWRQANK